MALYVNYFSSFALYCKEAKWQTTSARFGILLLKEAAGHHGVSREVAVFSLKKNCKPKNKGLLLSCDSGWMLCNAIQDAEFQADSGPKSRINTMEGMKHVLVPDGEEESNGAA